MSLDMAKMSAVLLLLGRSDHGEHHDAECDHPATWANGVPFSAAKDVRAAYVQRVGESDACQIPEACQACHHLTRATPLLLHGSTGYWLAPFPP